MAVRVAGVNIKYPEFYQSGWTMCYVYIRDGEVTMIEFYCHHPSHKDATQGRAQRARDYGCEVVYLEKGVDT